MNATNTSVIHVDGSLKEALNPLTIHSTFLSSICHMLFTLHELLVYFSLCSHLVLENRIGFEGMRCSFQLHVVCVG